MSKHIATLTVSSAIELLESKLTGQRAIFVTEQIALRDLLLRIDWAADYDVDENIDLISNDDEVGDNF